MKIVNTASIREQIINIINYYIIIYLYLSNDLDFKYRAVRDAMRRDVVATVIDCEDLRKTGAGSGNRTRAFSLGS